MSKYTPEDGQMPADPDSDNEGSEGRVDSSESANRPQDINHVTSNKAKHSGESDNRPDKPSI